MHFRIIGEISHIQTIATGTAIRERKRLRKLYGKGRWRKRRGIAKMQFSNGDSSTADTLV